MRVSRIIIIIKNIKTTMKNNILLTCESHECHDLKPT